MSADRDRTGTVRDLIKHWQIVAAARRTSIDAYGADDVERRARAQGYAEALLAACAQLSERLDDQPSDQDTELLTDLRRHIKSIESSLADAQYEIDTVLRRLGERS